MAREVDRLLAQLENSGPRPAQDDPSRGNGRSRDARRPRTVVLSAKEPSRTEVAALWGRLLLAVTLGVAMLEWPYPHRCNLPLAGYLAAVAMVPLAGVWVAVASWRTRSSLPHVLALAVIFWGMMLAAGQVLPRVGYAAEVASWRCR